MAGIRISGRGVCHGQTPLMDVTVCAIEDTFVQHGSVDELRRMLKLDADSLYDRIKHIISTDCTE